MTVLRTINRLCMMPLCQNLWHTECLCVAPHRASLFDFNGDRIVPLSEFDLKSDNLGNIFEYSARQRFDKKKIILRTGKLELGLTNI